MNDIIQTYEKSNLSFEEALPIIIGIGILIVVITIIITTVLIIEKKAKETNEKVKKIEKQLDYICNAIKYIVQEKDK